MNPLRRKPGGSSRPSFEELGYRDYLGALQRYRIEHPTDIRLLGMSSYLVDYPFADRLYPGALEVLNRLRSWGQTVILSDGDVVFQPRKVERSGISEAVARTCAHLQFLRFILRAPRVDFGVLCAGIATYLMLGLLWSFAYILVDGLVPNSFVFTVGPTSSHSMNHFNALYFSFTTLSTVGYGDIVPLSGAARMLAMVEAVFGMFYVTLLIARLVPH